MRDWKQKIKSKSGFTLAEVLLTVAIILVLCSVAFVAYTQWMRASRFKHNNDVADTVYSVLQVELAERRANNMLEELQQALAGSSGDSGTLDAYLTSITPESADASGSVTKGVKYDTIYSGFEEATGSLGTGITKGPIYYIKGTAADWATYQNNPETLSEPLRLLYDMLSEYLFSGDEDLLDGCICVEFDPVEGLIYSVFFSDQATELNYTDSDTRNINLLDRTTSARRSHQDSSGTYDLVGYCGVDSLSVSTSKITTKPVIENLTLNNEETLNLTFNLSVGMATPLMTYHIDVFDDAKDTKLLTIHMNKFKDNFDMGSLSSEIKLNPSELYYQLDKISGNSTSAVVDCLVQCYGTDGKTVVDTKVLTFPAWIDGDGKVTLVLDAVDYHTASVTAQSDYSDYLLNASADPSALTSALGVSTFENNASGKGIVAGLENTFSIYRLGIQDTDDIYCSVYAEGEGFSTTATKKSNTENRAFYDTEYSNGKHSYEIANARHLYNIRFEETAAALTIESTNEETKAETYVYTLRNNVNFADLAGGSTAGTETTTGGNIYSNYKLADTYQYSSQTTIGTSISSGSSDDVITSKVAEQTFPSFLQLGENSTLTSREGILFSNNYSLTGFTITKENNINWIQFKDSTAVRETVNNASTPAVGITKAALSADTSGTGLFLMNKGTIQRVTLTDITVDGAVDGSGATANSKYSSERTGAFCGTNEGTLKELTTASTTTGASQIIGDQYVGGIFGYIGESAEETEAEIETSNSVTIKGLTNEAAVSGSRYVGGIVGLLSSSSETTELKISDCQNYGSVTAKDKDSAYIGGIVGLADTAVLSDCISNPQYTGIPAETECLGYCVGGIVGLAYDTELSGCSTQVQRGYSRGYVVGNRFVGGIVGLSVGKNIIGGQNDTNAYNDTNVIGVDYVGGVAGCNADVKVLVEASNSSKLEIEVGKTEFDTVNLQGYSTLKEYIAEAKKDATSEEGSSWYDELKPDRLTPISARTDAATEDGQKIITLIQNWTNRGVVIAYKHYAGGITGYNTGAVYDCISSVHNTDDTISEIEEQCDYAGGIVGYNNGTLESRNNKKLSVECYVVGQNYVGGIVGYNDVDAVVRDYRVSGGTVKGTGSFIGGYAGLNASVNLLQTSEGSGDEKTTKALQLEANLNEISGSYCVGGVIGGNIVPVLEDTKIATIFNVDNFLGKISGDAVVGGYIGFNALPVVAAADVAENLETAALTAGTYTEAETAEAIIDAYRDILRNKVTEAIKELSDLNGTVTVAAKTPDKNGNYNNVVLQALETVASNGNEAENATSVERTATLSIGDAEGETITVTYSTGITGKIAVGGVIGYSSDATTLNVSKVKNQVPVSATDKIPYTQLMGLITGLQQSEVNKNNNNAVETYSIVGGIIGVVNEKTTLNSCSNADIGDVSGAGTYNGGLAELSLGKILKCTVASIGNTGRDFTGGLVGMNFGEISGTTVETATVTGRNYVGGIAAENYGEIILDGTINGLSVQATGDYAGGVAGYNGSARAQTTGSNESQTVDNNSSTDTQIGEIVMSNGLTITVNSTGKYAGGVIGYNASGKISTSGTGTSSDTDDAANSNEKDASVKGAVTGAAAVGGIIGRHSGGSLSQLVNQAVVTATSVNGDAAGIVGQVDAAENTNISSCVNYGTVTATTGNAAGIVGYNGAAVEKCANYGNISAPGGNAGGICVTNEKKGSITDCAITTPSENSTSDSWWGNLQNWIQSLIDKLQENGYSNTVLVQGRVNAGGITAENSGTVSGSILRNLSVSNYSNSESTSLVGGVTGNNTKEGTIILTGSYRDVTVQTNANGSAAGGVAGNNAGIIDGESEGSSGTISGSTTEIVGDPGTATDYTVYPYIVSSGDTDGGSYINTEYTATEKTRVVFVGYVEEGDTALFGSRLENLKTQFNIQYVEGPAYRVSYGGNNNKNNYFQQKLDTKWNVKEPMTFDMNKTRVLINGEKVCDITTNTNTYTFENNTYPLYICALNQGNKAKNFGKVYMYSMEIYASDDAGSETLKHKFLPATNKEGTVGVLDVADETSLKFIKADSTNEDKYSMKVGGDGETYKVGNTQKSTEITNLTIATGSTVTAANLGNVVGINEKEAKITGITVTNSAFADSVQTLLGGSEYGYGGIAGLNDGTISDSKFSGTISVMGSSASVANVGGIAGKNMSNGRIESCMVGMDNETVIGTDVEKRNNENANSTAFGYVGGIAGWNFGEIISCDNRPEIEKTEAQESSEDESTTESYSVFIFNYRGHTGGIVGYQAAGSYINGSEGKPVATGKKWKVRCPKFSGDCGTGGIIGYSESGNRGESIQYLYNYAETSSITSGESVAVGGIIGRFQNNENGNMVLNNCENHGSISGLLAGGFVGRIKYMGLTISNGLNTGGIKGSIIGGFIGDTYQNTSATIVNDCINDGNVSGTSAGGGIIGRDTNDSGTGKEAILTGCINNGIITGSNCGGMIGEVRCTSKTSFYRCRNYGQIGTTKSLSSGIASSFGVMKDCFDFRTGSSSILTTNTTASKVPVDSYYYSDTIVNEHQVEALKNWIEAPAEKREELASLVKEEFKERYSEESSKKGLPLVSYTTAESKLQLSSYLIWDVASNPVARIGIPRYKDPVNSSPATVDYDAMEIVKNNSGLSLMEQYYKDKYSGVINDDNSQVSKLSLSQEGSLLKATWNELTVDGASAYGYKLCYEITAENGQTETYYVAPIIYGTSWTVNIPDEWVGKTIIVHVRGVDGSEDNWKEQTAENSDEISPGCCWGANETVGKDNYKWACATSKIRMTLPTPEVYIELDGLTADGNTIDTGSYIAVLRNTDDYDAYMADNAGIKEVVINVVVGKNAANETNNTKCEIHYKKGDVMSSHSTKGMDIDDSSAANATVIATASVTLTDGGKYQSQKSNEQTYRLSGKTLKESNQLKTEMKGFSGILPSELTFGLNLIGYDKSELFVYQESELVVNRSVQLGDASASIPMAVSSNVARKTKTDTTVSIVLDDLPEDLLEGGNPEVSSKSFTVRCYPWYGQNEAIYFGHVVATGISESELAGLTDPHRAGASIFTNSELNPGYVIYQKTDDKGNISYEVRYSALIAEQSTYQKNIVSCTYDYTFDTTNGRNESNKVIVNAQPTTDSCTTDNSWTIQPYPVIAQTAETENDVYQFTWADSTGTSGEIKVDSAATYKLQLYGVDSDGNRILLKTTDVISNSGDCKDDMGNTCYSSESGGSWQYTFEDSAHNWNYSSLIVRVIRIGTADSAGATTVCPYYNEKTIKLKQRFTTMTAPTVTVPEDSGTMDYGISWEPIPESEQKNEDDSCDFRCYEITIEDVTTAEGHTPIETQTWYAYRNTKDEAYQLIDTLNGEEEGSGITESVPSGSTDPTLNLVVLSLDDFEGCNVSISVKAIAVENSTVYRDGAPGTARTLQLASRLEVPDMKLLTMIPRYGVKLNESGEEEKEQGEEKYSTPREDIESAGLTLTMKNDAKYSSVSGLYEVKLYIYDEITDEAGNVTEQLCYEIDMDKMSSKFMEGRLNEGDSTYNVPNELPLVTEEGDTSGETKYVYLADLAGKYLYVSLRATSDSAISSYWSKDVAEGTVGDAGEEGGSQEPEDHCNDVTRIPRMKLTAPELSDGGEQAISYTVYGYKNDSETPEKVSENDIQVHQKVITWPNDITDGGYILHLTYKTNSKDETEQRKAFDVRLTRNEEEQLMIDGSVGSVLSKERTPIGDKIHIEQAITDESEWSSIFIDLQTYISLSEDGTAVMLYLPDNDQQAEEVRGALDHTGEWTKNVTVSAISPDEEDNYLSSDGAYIADGETGTYDLQKLPIANGESEQDVKVTVSYDAEQAQIVVNPPEGDFAGSYRFMIRVHYKDDSSSDDDKVSEEFTMKAENENGSGSAFDPSELGDDWTEITSVELRVICTSNHNLFSDEWSESITLTPNDNEGNVTLTKEKFVADKAKIQPEDNSLTALKTATSTPSASPTPTATASATPSATPTGSPSATPGEGTPTPETTPGTGEGTPTPETTPETGESTPTPEMTPETGEGTPTPETTPETGEETPTPEPITTPETTPVPENSTSAPESEAETTLMTSAPASIPQERTPVPVNTPAPVEATLTPQLEVTVVPDTEPDTEGE